LKAMEAFGSTQECLDLVRPLQRVSRGGQADWKFSQYQLPVLLGRGMGAALVYVALAQAWPYVFAGGMSVDFTPTITLNRTLCGAIATAIAKGQRLSPQSRLRSGWQLGSTHPLSAEAAAFAHDARRANGADTVPIAMPKTLTALYNDAIESFLRQLEAGQRNAFASLPIIEVSNDTAEKTLVIVYSGDAGWRVLESGLADVLKDEGYAVLGIDGSRYFWLEQTPERVAQDLARMMEYYRDKWRIDRVVLAGYAFGANLLPFAYNRLPAELQNSVSLIVFVSPNRVARFGLGEVGWLGDERDPERWPLEPEMRRLDAPRLQCIYGKAEARDSLCTAPVMSNAQIIEQFAIDPHNLNMGEDLAEFIISRIERGRQELGQ
ncbi:MAG: AcvB/VirJ family lysyl-phosphatidylglycerol hydrolase, partial [Gammaproteobacteria bacterium]